MNPLTLSFSDKRLEDELRASQFVSAKLGIQVGLGFCLLTHVFMSSLTDKYHIISAIYSPAILFLLAYRSFVLERYTDHRRAHELMTLAWLGVLIMSNSVQRYTIFVGWHPRIEPVEATLYMFNYTFVVIVLHLQFISFYYRLAMLTSIFLSLSTAGWKLIGDEGWTSIGQPYDTVIVGMALGLGTVMGHAIEAMLRGAFLARSKGRENTYSVQRETDSELAREIAPHAFEQIGLIGRGGSADVFLVRRSAGGGKTADDGQLYAMKRIPKARLSPARLAHVREERAILRALGAHPFLVALHHAFESERCFYFALTYAEFGDLTRWLHNLSDASARLVASECLLALEYLHSRQILYRDIKPENTLIAHDGHILLADFGVSKRLVRTTIPAPAGSSNSSSTVPGGSSSPVPDAPGETYDDDDWVGGARTRTQVGTLDYMSPELFSGDDYSYEVDYWALAVMLHELLTGSTIGSRSNPEIAEVGDPDTEDLLVRMLTPAREQRLGFGSDGLQQIKAHPYFGRIDWRKLLQKEMAGPIDAGRLTFEGSDRLTTDSTARRRTSSMSEALTDKKSE